jgi:hypothetical protein
MAGPEAVKISLLLVLLTQLEHVYGFLAHFQSHDGIVHKSLVISAACSYITSV